MTILSDNMVEGWHCREGQEVVVVWCGSEGGVVVLESWGQILMSVAGVYGMKSDADFMMMASGEGNYRMAIQYQ